MWMWWRVVKTCAASVIGMWTNFSACYFAAEWTQNSWGGFVSVQCDSCESPACAGQRSCLVTGRHWRGREIAVKDQITVLSSLVWILLWTFGRSMATFDSFYLSDSQSFVVISIHENWTHTRATCWSTAVSITSYFCHSWLNNDAYKGSLIINNDWFHTLHCT